MEIERRRIEITCTDNILIRGYINVIQNRKIIELFKDPNENFFLLYDAEIHRREEPQSFKLSFRLVERKDTLILNKEAIRWVIEI